MPKYVYYSIVIAGVILAQGLSAMSDSHRRVLSYNQLLCIRLKWLLIEKGWLTPESSPLPSSFTFVPSKATYSRQILDLYKQAEKGLLLHWIAFFGYVDAFKYIRDNMLVREVEFKALLNTPIAEPFGVPLENIIRDQHFVAGSVGLTPLHVAVDCGHVDLVKELVDSGANINALDAQLRTPYQRAIQIGQRAVVEELRQLGAIVEFEVPRPEQRAPVPAPTAVGTDELCTIL